MTAIPLSPVAHVGIIPAYKAGVDAVQSSMEEVFGSRAHESVQDNNKGTRKAHLLPPLGAPAAGGGRSDGGAGEGVRRVSEGGGSDGDGETKDDADRLKRLEEAGSFSQVILFFSVFFNAFFCIRFHRVFYRWLAFST